MSFEEMLKNLQREYLNSMPEKISVIRMHIDAGTAANLQEAFHKLKGTGKTYGIPEISELAATVEDICQETPDQASKAARQAVAILVDITSARKSDTEFKLKNDPRFKALLR